MENKKIKDITLQYHIMEDMNVPDFIEEYINDQRPGVRSLVGLAQKQLYRQYEEKKRLEKMRLYEQQYEQQYTFICGIDEAGRGPLAGPVVAGAVILPKDCEILYLNDSKKLSEKKREELFLEIQQKAISAAVGIIEPADIDRYNILQATYMAMRKAIENLSQTPDILLNDAVTIPEVHIPQCPIIKGDAKSVSIAAASIMAKVTRDHIMYEYDKQYPEYGFAEHKGYGTQMHYDAILKYGKIPIHRTSFLRNLEDHVKR